MIVTPSKLRLSYQPPLLEPCLWVQVTGVSLPIGTSALDNPLEVLDSTEDQE
jgi:hypothetical protein